MRKRRMRFNSSKCTSLGAKSATYAFYKRGEKKKGRKRSLRTSVRWIILLPFHLFDYVLAFAVYSLGDIHRVVILTEIRFHVEYFIVVHAFREGCKWMPVIKNIVYAYRELLTLGCRDDWQNGSGVWMSDGCADIARSNEIRAIFFVLFARCNASSRRAWKFFLISEYTSKDALFIGGFLFSVFFSLSFRIEEQNEELKIIWRGGEIW